METDRTHSLENAWISKERWHGIKRPYSAEDVRRLSGSVQPDHTLARKGAERFWRLLNEEPYVRALGALTGNQALQQVRAGLKAIYVSGWQVAADANDGGEMYPDQSLYPCHSVPGLVRRINKAFLRADQISHLEASDDVYWFAPIIADGEAGFGGSLNAFELMKGMIEAGAAAVHFEDQSASLKKCGHMGGKVVIPAQEFITKLVAARLASDITNVPTILIARTDANGARLITSDFDAVDQSFLTGKRTSEGYFEVNGGLEYAITRGLSFAPYADLVWCETSSPDLGEAREFAQSLHETFPGKLLAYNCSPSFNWKKYLDEQAIARFQDELASMGYKFQFVTLAGFHSLNASMFELARAYRREGMPAYSGLQDREFALERTGGYEAVKHQRFVGTGYFDEVQLVVSGGRTSTKALEGSTELQQFV
ncbi:MAG TPA: isocitrate lyase [Bacteroidota bacterium]|nr:isocitrate lyase [Bacteroidota bacterium]